MKEFLEKYKKVFIIVLIILLFLAILTGVYFIFLKDLNLFHLGDGNNVATEESSNTEETSSEVTPLKDFDERGSKEAIIATSAEAVKWATDVKLYDCSGLTTSSYKYSDITYYFVAAEEGKYAEWICTYYSASKDQTRIYMFDEGDVVEEEAMDNGEYGYLMYGGIDYPTNLESIVDSTVIYAKTVAEGLDDSTNYVNMYLGDTIDYGYVWRIEERSKTEKNEYDIGLLVNTYLFDISGNLTEVTQEEVN